MKRVVELELMDDPEQAVVYAGPDLDSAYYLFVWCFQKFFPDLASETTILDLGCGDGALLHRLMEEKDIYGLGIDINTDAVLSCIEKGVSVIQEDVDEGLEQYKDGSYDYVVLSETLQAVLKPDYLLDQIVRIGKKAIVSFPNFGYYKVRLKLFFNGRMPKSDALPYEWYNTPNIHLLTINDFRDFCRSKNIKITKEICLTKKWKRSVLNIGPKNFFADEAVFLIEKGE